MSKECIRERCFCWNYGGYNSCRKIEDGSKGRKKRIFSESPYPTETVDDVDGRGNHPSEWMKKRDEGMMSQYSIM